MGIFDDEITLPGVIVHVEADYSYGFDSSLFGTTDSELVIGTAFNGPVGQAVPVYSPEHAAYIFGDAYDAVKKEEATLISGVQDAWDRGCRTIYACRIGGKTMHKDFCFKVEVPYKLRLSSIFPSNAGKQCYMLYDGTPGLQSITFYKPVERATIQEMNRGLTSGSDNVLKTTIKLALDNGLTKDDRLVDLIKLFNENTSNNVLLLSIVDKDGNDVTNSPEVYDIPVGAMYSGAYFIGREFTNEAVNVVTETEFQLVNEDTTNLPYNNFDKKYFRRLVRNTDVSQAYPIYDEKMSVMRQNIRGAQVLMVKDWDFLETSGLSERLFVCDKEDYEETNLSKFEIYKRLGSGFAITAKASPRKSNMDKDGRVIDPTARPRVRETAAEDKNRIVAIEDGIYSVLQDANMRYRVLTCANAEDEINGRLPRAEDFKVAVAQDVVTLGGDMRIMAKVDKTDMKAPIKYSIRFEDIEAEGGIAEFAEVKDLDVSAIHPIVAAVDGEAAVAALNNADFENGTFVFDGTHLHRSGDKAFDKLEGAGMLGKTVIAGGKLFEADADGAFVEKALADQKKFLLAEVLGHVFVMENRTDALVNIGDLATLMSDEEDKVVVAAENLRAGHVNEIVIRSNEFDSLTLEELVDTLNQNEVFSTLFTATLTEDGSLEKDDFVNEGEHSAKGLGEAAVLMDDRSVEYDYSLYIPYRTTDNFLRQMAQHCTYTELKTAPTHGVVGTKVLTNVGLTAVSNAVNEILNKDFDLYAKNIFGQNFLDRNKLPYPVGKNVSLVFGQYPVVMEKNNFTHMSNGAAGYAGFITTLPVEQSTTGQSINLSDLSYMLTNTQLGRLTKAGIVTFKKSFTKGIVVTDGVTMAPADSVFRRLSTSRIVGTVEEIIRAAAEPYIGKENHQANRDALNTALKANLDKIKGTLIEQYNFQMNTDPNLAKFSYIEISYQVIPIYEIREVRNSIKMVDSITTATVGA